MIYINILVLLLYLMLAIISRKHFSKYKGIKKVPYAISDFVMELMDSLINLEKIQHSIKRLQVTSPENVRAAALEIVRKNTAVCLVAFWIFNLVSLCACLTANRVAGNVNVLERDDYNGTSREYEICLTYEEEESTVSLLVAPKEYSVEEFYEKSDRIFSGFEAVLAGENEDLQHIRGDIYIPESPEKAFDLMWLSDTPKILTSTGKVCNENLKEKVYVTLTAVIEYNNLTAEHDYILGIEGRQKKSPLELAEEELYELELGNRNEKEIYIPRELSGVKISLADNKHNTSVQIFLLGILFCVSLAFREAAGFKKKIKERENRLMELYPWFVNSMWLLLGAGLTVRSGINQLIADNEKDNPLVLELEFAFNQIKSGADESVVYEELGKKIGLNVYERLMHQLSRNLKIGTKNLLGLMEDELAVAMNIKRENIKKKGEEASTKLLFPMAVLLLVVMLIIITPVLVSL